MTRNDKNVKLTNIFPTKYFESKGFQGLIFVTWVVGGRERGLCLINWYPRPSHPQTSNPGFAPSVCVIYITLKYSSNYMY